MNNFKPYMRKQNDLYTIYDMQIGDHTLSVTYLNPHQATTGHQHKQEEGYYFTYGFGEMELEGKVMEVSMGDFVQVPPNAYHRVVNTKDFSLVFVCVFHTKETI